MPPTAQRGGALVQSGAAANAPTTAAAAAAAAAAVALQTRSGGSGDSRVNAVGEHHHALDLTYKLPPGCGGRACRSPAPRRGC